MYLGGAISESEDLDIEIKRRIGAAWASVRKYSSQLYDRRNARLSLKIRLFKAEVMEAMLYGCATANPSWRFRVVVSMRSEPVLSRTSLYDRGLYPMRSLRRKPIMRKSSLWWAVRRLLKSWERIVHVRRGPCTARRLKAFKASHVWAAGGARTQARRPTGDVVGGLPPEKSRGLRGGPAQRQRTEVGRIRSCCQGWTGLDDCCEEHGPVAPGGREGSGSTRQRLATRGPSSIQRATPARG